MRHSSLPSTPERWLRAVLGDTPVVSTIIGDLREEYGALPPGALRTIRYATACASITVRYVPALLMDVTRVECLHSVRSLMRARTYVAASVLTLALGIGIAATLLTITYGSLLRPLPYPRAEDLIALGQSPLTSQGAGSVNSIAVANLRDLSPGLQQLTGLAGYVYRRVNAATHTGAQQLLTMSVTGNFFDVLEARPLLGRLITPDDDVAGVEPTVILAERTWRREFNAAPDLIGTLISLDTVPHRVIGVMPGHLPWPGDPQAWTPMQWTPEESAVRNRRAIEGLGRVARGATLAGATAELQARFATLAQQYPTENGASTVATRPLSEIILGSVGPNRSLLPLLAGLAALMLGVAYVNLGTLAVGRREAHRHEFALRQILGAAQWRQRLSRWTESGIVCVMGAAAGTVFAAWAIPLVTTRYGAAIARAQTIGFDQSTMTVVAVASAAGVMVMSVTGGRRSLPCVGDLNRRSTTGAGKIRRRLVAVQVGLAGGLVYGAVLLGGMIASMARVDLGVPLDGGLTFALGIPTAQYRGPAEVRQFFNELESQLRAIPGVVAVGGTSRTPFAGGTNGGVANADAPDREVALAEWRAVTPGFFGAIGLTFIDGRPFDDGGDLRTVVVSADLSEGLFGTRRSVGRRVRAGAAAPYTVTGVVSDIRDFGPTRPGRPTIYFHHGSETGFASARDLTMVVRAEVPPASLTPAIRERVKSVDRSVPIRAVLTLDELASRSLGTNRTTARTVLLTLAGLALLLGMIGVFGVAAVNVERRTREIGVRLALGDTPSGILRLVVSDGLRLTIAGLALAAGVSWYVHQLVESFLVPAYQPGTLPTVVLVLVVVLATTTLASLLPAYRAARLSPTEALRAE